MICERCGKKAGVSTVSFFNTQEICMTCMKKEQAHPGYPAAHAAEVAAIKAGDYNFPGVGLPPELASTPTEEGGESHGPSDVQPASGDTARQRE